MFQTTIPQIHQHSPITFGRRPFVKRFALCYRTVVRPVCLTFVCCGQTVGWIKMPLGTEVRLGPGHIVLDGDPALPHPERGTGTPPYFLAHVYCGQTVAHLSTAELLWVILLTNTSKVYNVIARVCLWTDKHRRNTTSARICSEDNSTLNERRRSAPENWRGRRRRSCIWRRQCEPAGCAVHRRTRTRSQCRDL